MSFVEAFVRLAKASAAKRRAQREAAGKAASTPPINTPEERPMTPKELEKEKAAAIEHARVRLVECMTRRGIPLHMREGVIDYMLYGMPLGSDSFLRNVLANRLVQSIGKADDENRAAIFKWAEFLYNDMPVGSWGDDGRMQHWQGLGGLIGRMFAKEKAGA